MVLFLFRVLTSSQAREVLDHSPEWCCWEAQGHGWTHAQNLASQRTVYPSPSPSLRLPSSWLPFTHKLWNQAISVMSECPIQILSLHIPEKQSVPTECSLSHTTYDWCWWRCWCLLPLTSYAKAIHSVPLLHKQKLQKISEKTKWSSKSVYRN